VLPYLVMLYLVAKPPHVEADVDRASLHRPTGCGWQTKGQSPLTDTVLLYLVAELLLKVSSPMPVHILLLSGKCTESLGRHCPI
jgi:hypothetical protein